MESSGGKRKPPAPEWLRRRINAARELAEPTEAELRERSVHRQRGLGYGLSVEELAARIDREGFGDKVIGMIRRGERPIDYHELEWIARACGVPMEFFSVDFEQLPKLLGERPGLDALLTQMSHLESMMAEIRTALTQLEDAGAPGVPGATGRELRAGLPTPAGHRRPERAGEEG